MILFTSEQESYIKHEVQLRLHDEKFIMLEKKIDRMDNKMNFMMTIIFGSIILPVILHYLGWTS